MRQQPHRLPDRFGAIESGGQGIGQPASLLQNRAAPVEGKRDDFVGSLQILDQVEIGAGHRRLGHHPGSAEGELAKTAGGNIDRIEPDPVAIHRQMTSHDPGDEDDQRLRRAGRAAVDAAADFPGRRQRLEALVGIAGQGQLQAAGGPLVAKIIEMADRRPLVEYVTGPLRPRRAAVHGTGVDHQIVVLAVEQVGGQHLQPPPQPSPFDIAGDHRQVGFGLDPGPVEHGHQRRFGHHRLDPRQFVGLGPGLDHRQQKIGGQIVNGAPLERRDQTDGVDDDRQVAVETPRGQGRPPGRAGHPDEAFDPEGLGLQQLAQLNEQFAVALAILAFKASQVVGVEGHSSSGQGTATEQFADQPAAGMADQVQPRSRRQLTGQNQGVFDGALAEGAMLKAEQVAGKAFVQRLEHRQLGAFPKAAEAPFGARGGAVQKEQGRPVAGKRNFAGSQRPQLATVAIGAAVKARSGLQLVFELAGDGGGGLLRQLDVEDA